MKSGLTVFPIGILFLILVSCAGSPELVSDIGPEADIRRSEEIAETDVPAVTSTEEIAAEVPAPSESADTALPDMVPESAPEPLPEPEKSEFLPPGTIPEAGKDPRIAADSAKAADSDSAGNDIVPLSKSVDTDITKVPETAKPQRKDFAVKVPLPEPVVSTIPKNTIPPVNPLLSEDRPLQSPAAVAPGSTGRTETAPPSTVPASGGPLAAPPAATAAPASTPVQPAASTGLPSPAAAAVPSAPESFSSPLNDPSVAAAAPARLLDSPGEFTITLAGLGWIFRSDLSTPGTWRFLERIRNGESTGFRFRFTESGDWNLVFERQDPSSGGSEQQTRAVHVGDDGGSSVVENGPLPSRPANPISGDLPMNPDSRNAAAEESAARGDIDQALEFWERDASDTGESGRRARRSIVDLASQSGSVGPLIRWLPDYMKDGADPEILAAALKVFEGQAGYEEQSMVLLEALADLDRSDRRPEWLYRQASILEKPGPERDLDRAAMLYQEVINQWPLSSWRDLSEERLQWLKRHYFRVR